MLELHSDELRGHHAISGMEKKGKWAKFKHDVFFNTTLGSYPRIYLPNNLNWIVSKTVGENLLKLEHTRWHVIPKKTLLVYKSGIKQHDTLQQQISLCPLVWLCATSCSGKILLQRQDFQKKLICPRNITYCHNMLLHLVTKCSNLLHLSTEKWGVLKFSFDVVNTCSSHFTDCFGSFAWHIPFHLVHQQSSVWQYKHGSWSLNPLLFQNCHLWLWLKEQGSWLCMMHC